MAYSNYSSTQAPLMPPPQPPMELGLVPNTQPPLPPFDSQQMLATDQQTRQQQVMQQQLQHLQQHYLQMNQMMHPAMNDQPLEFNMNKNKPPLPIVSEQPANGEGKRDDSDRRDRDTRRGDRRDRDRRDRRDRDRDRDRGDRDGDRKRDRDDEDKDVNSLSQVNPPLPPTMPGMPMMGINNMMGGMMGAMGGMMGAGMMPMMDPSGMMMSQYGMMPGMMGDGSMMQPDAGMSAMMTQDPSSYTTPSQLEFKECTLVAPSPMAPTPTTRERPPGCRTVYIGGLPDNCKEEIIRDVFGRCGEILTVRLSKKNFCHVRFAMEESVDAAILYSGYRMRIGGNTDAPNTGRLHVDYAQAHVDQYEYECKQRMLQREARHRERVERDRLRPASPPPLPHYTDHEASVVAESIKGMTDEGFKKSVETVISWLERGDLTKRNANTFYAMIQSTHSHVRRLLNEKMQFEEELQHAKELHRTRVHTIVTQFAFIERVFSCASHKKCWDHFTKAQRKNIETWKKQSTEIKQLQLVVGMNEEAEEEMDVSDNEDGDYGSARKRQKTDINSLKDENDSLKCQLEAYKNEVDILKVDQTELDNKDKQLKLLQQAMATMRSELTASKNKLRAEEANVLKLKTKLSSVENGGTEAGAAKEAITDKDEETVESPAAAAPPLFSDKDARLIALIGTFLHVHPFGASVDYIWSYLSKLEQSVKVSDVEMLLSRFPTVFRQELTGIGATMERRWIFSGFEVPLV